MARILITGSADGLGSLAARQLIRRGHTVILHARNAQRAEAARQACPGAETVLIGDLSSIAETKKLAADANAFTSSSPETSPEASSKTNDSKAPTASKAAARPIDCVIHNAGLYRGGPARTGDDRIPSLTAVNTIAPYLLTCLMDRPSRLVYVTSGYHHSGDPSLRDITWQERGDGAWDDLTAYKDSKLHDVLLAKAFAGRWGSKHGVRSNALDPGWVPTKMGGASAPGSLDAAVETYVMLAEGAGGPDGKKGEGGDATGKLFGPRRKESRPKLESDDVAIQDKLIEILEGITGVKVPE